MKSRSIVATICSILLIYVPFAEPSDSQAVGTLRSSGAVEVNGEVAPVGAIVFAGDRIVSPNGASTTLSLTGGSRLILAGLGSFQIRQSGVQTTAKLENGNLAVLSRASAPIAIEAAGTRIASNKGDAVYAVAVEGNTLQVMASKGATEVEGADRTIEVSEGNILDATTAPPGGSDSRKPASPAATGGYAGYFTFERVVLITAAAAAGAALGLAIENLGKTCRPAPSPTNVRCD